MNGNCQCNKIKLNFLDRRNSQLNTSLLFGKMWGRLNVDFKNRLKSDLFLKSYIYSERGDFAASFYNKNSILMFFSKWSIFRGGALSPPQKSQFFKEKPKLSFYHRTMHRSFFFQNIYDFLQNEQLLRNSL